MSVIDLVRPDLRGFAGYQSARKAQVQGDVWLNANESAWENVHCGSQALRRYPEPQPIALRARLAELYDCLPGQILAGRGSDEAIDLLVRALCRPGQDAIVTTPPTFGMYAVCARLHGVPVVEVPLQDSVAGFACDFEGVSNAAIANAARLVFLCSPGNPTGTALPMEPVRGLAERLRGQAVVVVDEAYLEYAGTASAARLLESVDNIAVLRTLSKAHALAAARVGSVIAAPELIDVLKRCQAPYPIATPCAEVALAALSPEACRDTDGHVARVLLERQRLSSALRAAPGVVQVYPSSSNFLLVRLVDAEASWQALLSAGVVVRDVRAQPGLENALRISIGTSEENDRVLAVLATAETGVSA